MPGLILPFKPFTLDEVKAITGAPGAVVDKWCKLFVMKEGCGVVGLDYLQMFALYVAYRYEAEGSGYDRAEAVLRFVMEVGINHVEQQCSLGFTFVVPQARTMVAAPASRLGQTLNMKVLNAEFRHKLKQMSPSTDS